VARSGPEASGAQSRLWRRVLLLGILAVMVAVAFLVGRPPAPLPPALVLSGAESGGNVSLARDCGYSAPLPADPRRSLWLFCDTPIYVRRQTTSGRVTWALRRFIPGSTAAEGRAVVGSSPGRRVPGQLSEVGTALGRGAAPGGAPSAGDAPAPGHGPTPFLLPPGGLVTSTGLPCGSDGSYPASWVSGVARVPASSELLIAFDNYCVQGGAGGILPEGFGLAEYDPATGMLSNDANVFSGMNLVVAAAAKLLGSPVFSGRYLYLFGPTCTALAYGGCVTGTLFEARVPATPRAWSDPLNYRWQSSDVPGSWTPDPVAATSIITGATPAAVSVADMPTAGRQFILVEQTDITGDFSVYESPAPAGTWHPVLSGRVPCRAGAGLLNFCRAIIVHPELSTPTQLVLSYFDPGAGPGGHVMVAGFDW
jgi:hypothetical protein